MAKSSIDTQPWINSTIEKCNEFLRPYGMSVVYNARYDFQRSSYYKKCYAVYQNGSVKNKGKISIGLNIPLIMSKFKKGDYKRQIEMSVWHEAGHGIVEYLKGLRRKDTQCGTKIFKKEMLTDFKIILEDEEYYVEEFALSSYLSSTGIDSDSLLHDFLKNYDDKLLAIRNQEGGSKWLEHFRQEEGAGKNISEEMKIKSPLVKLTALDIKEMVSECLQRILER